MLPSFACAAFLQIRPFDSLMHNQRWRRAIKIDTHRRQMGIRIIAPDVNETHTHGYRLVTCLHVYERNHVWLYRVFCQAEKVSDRRLYIYNIIYIYRQHVFVSSHSFLNSCRPFQCKFSRNLFPCQVPQYMRRIGHVYILICARCFLQGVPTLSILLQQFRRVSMGTQQSYGKVTISHHRKFDVTWACQPK